MAVLLAVVLVASSSLAGLTPLSGNPLESGEPGQTEGPADNLTDHPLIPEPAPEEPWWDEWLDRFDKSGTRVDDEAEEVARTLIEEGRPDAPVSVLVTYKETPTEEDTALLMDRFHADPEAIHVLATGPTVLAEIPARFVTELGSIPGVAAVEWDYPLERVLTISAPSTQAREFIGSSTTNQVYNGMTAQALGYTGTGTVIAVIDTGIQPTHPAVSGKIIATADSSTIATVQCTVSHDIDGHGTHVASTAAGNPPNDNRKGTAMDASLVDVQISKQIITIGGIQRGLNWVFQYNNAIDQGDPRCGVGLDDRIDVATVSFGSAGRGGPNAGSTESTINALTNQGVVVTIAVGNCGPQASALCNFSDVENGISSPGNAANAIGVAASSHGNTVERNNDNIAGFSSRGPNSGTGATSASNLQDRHRKPDITGPGVGISAANAFHITGPDYVSMSGTSMSTPHVAGIAALLIEAGEDARSQIGGPNLMQPNASVFTSGNYVMERNPVRDAMIFSADYRTANVPSSMLTKWEGPNSLGTPWNNGWGYGSVDAFAAICWAWANVLEPAGATPPATVTATCPSTLLSANAGGPYDGTAGEPITFTGSAQGGEDPYTFEWDLGDGNTTTGTQPQHTYAFAGTYTVQLTITDDEATVETDTTTVTVSESDPPPPGDTQPFVEITSPADTATVQGNVTITGIAGHAESETQTSGSTGVPSNSMSLASLVAASAGQGLSLQHGENTLWFRGEDIDGIGTPNVDGLHEAWLLPDPPGSDTPVIHTGSDAADSKITLTSPPLSSETRLGDGNPDTLNNAVARFHLQAWSHVAQGGVLHAELNAIKDDTTLPLGKTALTTGLNMAPHLRQMTIPLATSVNNPPVNQDGDLIVPPGYSLQFRFWVQTTSPLTQHGLLFSVLYDTEEFDSRIEFVVNDGPTVTTFEASPSSGEAPLEVTFTGTVEPGADPVDHVLIDPGDGSDPIGATLAGSSFHAVHTYVNEGSWEASATVTDVEGRTGGAKATVSVMLVEREEGVYIEVGGDQPVLAVDTSAANDWSTWEIVHNFSAYEDSEEVTISAVYFNGTAESAPHNITVVVGSTSNDDGGSSDDPNNEDPPQSMANVTITSPLQDDEVLPDFRAQGTVESDTTNSTGTGESFAASSSAPQLEVPPELDLSLMEAMRDPAFAKLHEALAHDSSYLGLEPDPDVRTVHALYDGGLPGHDLPVHLLPPGWTLEAIETQWERAVLRNVTVVDMGQDHRSGPPLPETAVSLGPGSRIAIDRIPGESGTFGCTANFIWEDQDRNLYLGSAGHCFLPEVGATATDGPGADHNVGNTRTRVCVSACNFGGQVGFVLSGQMVELGPVVYARQSGAGGDTRNDFGLVYIPENLRGLVRTHMPVWDGPEREQNIGFGDITVHYGAGIGVGETWPTMGRAGFAHGGDSQRWVSGHPINQGDSGSAISVGVLQADEGIIRGEGAGGVITHIGLTDNPGRALGPTLTRVQQLTLRDVGLEISVRTEGPVPPGVPRNIQADPSSGQVTLQWDPPVSDGGAPISGYTVKWGTKEEGSFSDTLDVGSPTATFTNLTNGKTYFFAVSATNQAGEGPDTPEIDVSLMGLPSAPQNLVASAGDGQVVLSWDEPASDGGSPILEYSVYWGTSSGGPYPETTSVGTSTAIVSPLTNGQTYHFTVSATNEFGEGPASSEVSATPDESPLSVEVRLLNETDTVLDWIEVDHFDGSAWFHDFKGIPAGGTTMQARLLENEDVVSTDEVSFTVLMPNRPPQLDPIGNQTVGEGMELDFIVTAFDPDGDPISLSAHPLPAGAAFTDHGNATGTFSWTPEKGQVGEYVVTFNATDGEFVHDETITIFVAESVAFVEITSPQNGSSVQGPTEIEGITGHFVLNGEEPGPGDGESSGGAMALTMSPPSGEVMTDGSLSLEIGGNTLWFRGENTEGLGLPNVGDLHPAHLLPQAPEGIGPVVHASSDSVDGKITLTSPPLGSETRLGNGNPDTPNEAVARFHLQAWSHVAQGGVLHAELNAIKDDTTLPLGKTALTTGLNMAPHLRQMTIPLATSVNNPPVNQDGDLIVPPGYSLQFRFWVQTTSPLTQHGLLFSVLYDTEEFDSHLELQVSPRTGSPSIVDFQASPTTGGLPLEVAFTGVVEPGANDIDRVEIKPGDGTTAFNATLESSGFNAEHTYLKEGQWDATATVFDLDGRATSATVVIDVTIDTGVYVNIAGGPLQKAEDTSESGDWSTWRVSHDFSTHENDTWVMIEAFFFDGFDRSEPHNVSVLVGSSESPEAVIEGHEMVSAGENATFDGSSSRGNIVSWQWDFGDGSIADGPVVSHNWPNPGPRTVTLKVSDAAGLQHESSHRVNVTGRPANTGNALEGGA